MREWKMQDQTKYGKPYNKKIIGLLGLAAQFPRVRNNNLEHTST